MTNESWRALIVAGMVFLIVLSGAGLVGAIESDNFTVSVTENKER